MPTSIPPVNTIRVAQKQPKFAARVSIDGNEMLSETMREMQQAIQTGGVEALKKLMTDKYQLSEAQAAVVINQGTTMQAGAQDGSIDIGGIITCICSLYGCTVSSEKS